MKGKYEGNALAAFLRVFNKEGFKILATEISVGRRTLSEMVAMARWLNLHEIYDNSRNLPPLPKLTADIRASENGNYNFFRINSDVSRAKTTSRRI